MKIIYIIFIILHLLFLTKSFNHDFSKININVTKCYSVKCKNLLPLKNGTFLSSFNILHQCILKSNCNKIYEKNNTIRLKMQNMLLCWNYHNFIVKDLPKLCNLSGIKNFFNCAHIVSNNCGSPAPY